MTRVGGKLQILLIPVAIASFSKLLEYERIKMVFYGTLFCKQV